jgi:hypothetical protein
VTMHIAAKVAGLATAGAVTAGVVAVATMASPSSNTTVSANSSYKTSRPPSAAAVPADMMCRYNVVGMKRGKSLHVMSGRHRAGSLRSSATAVPGDCMPANGQVMVQASNGRTGWVSAGHLSRQTIVVFLATRYAVRNVRHGHNLTVWTRTGMKWRAAGTLRWNDRHVTANILDLRRTTTVVVVVGHRLEAVVVPARSAVVIARDGKVGIVASRFLTRVRTPTPVPTPPLPTVPVTPAPTMTPPVTVTPSPSGSQAPVINGLAPRRSTKW